VTVAPSENDAFIAIRSWLLSVLPVGVEVFQGQENRVPQPAGPDFVMMTMRSRTRQATNVETWDPQAEDPEAVEARQSTRFVMQLDVHGRAGGDMAQTITTLWRSDFACRALFPSGLQPLYAEDPRQVPFVNGEKQYENRYVVEIAFQGSPVVLAPQQFAAILSVELQGIP
jgi:hypothetical protein